MLPKTQVTLKSCLIIIIILHCSIYFETLFFSLRNIFSPVWRNLYEVGMSSYHIFSVIRTDQSLSYMNLHLINLSICSKIVYFSILNDQITLEKTPLDRHFISLNRINKYSHRQTSRTSLSLSLSSCVKYSK